MKRLPILGIIALAFFLYFELRFPGSQSALASYYASVLVLLALSTVSVAAAAYGLQELKAQWISLAACTGIWTLGGILEVMEVYLRQPAYGAISDGFWVTGYLPLLAGLWKTSMELNPWRSPGAITTPLLFVVINTVAVVFVAPMAVHNVDRTIVLVLGWAYYLCDVATVFLASVNVIAAGRLQANSRRALNLLLFALIVLYLCDVIVTLIPSFVVPIRRWMIFGYAAGYLLLFYAGRSARQSRAAGSG